MITKPGWQSAIFMIILIISSLSGVVTATELFVNGDTGNDSWDGLAPEWDGVHGPKKTIQAGIDAAVPGVIVTVADGTYTGSLNKDLDFNGKSITLRSATGAENCIIECENSGRGFYFHSGETPTAIVDGFTITNGCTSGDGGGGICCRSDSSPTITNCTISGNSTGSNGGGIFCYYYSSPTITNCTISGNSASDYGGGIFCYYYSSPTITNCMISGNSANSHGGGGIYCNWFSNPTITNCTISVNSVFYSGGGICCEYYGSPTIANCTIIGNSAKWAGGGGISCRYSSPTITNCTISGNSVFYRGGGIFCHDNASPTITNCTISGNSADKGGGVSCYYNSSPTITNCILWGNVLNEIFVESGTPFVTYSNVQGGTGKPWFGIGCIDQDPLFVKGALHDYYLSQVASGQDVDSPCVDAGSDTAENLGLDELSTRTDGMPDEGIVDMGYHAPYALWIDSITKNGDDITIHWNARAGVSYVVELSYNLEMWHGFGVGEVSEVTDYGAGMLPQVYYRVKEE